jgi:outer membrane protein TolC
MKKIVMALSVGGLLSLLFAAAPVSLVAEEYSLEELSRIALTRSEKLRAAEENLTIAETGKDKAFSYMLPRLTAKRSLTRRQASCSRRAPHPGGSGLTRPSR